MNLVLCDLCKFPDPSQRAFDVRYLCSLCLIRCQIVNTGDQRPHLAQNTNATVRALWEIDGFLAAKQPFDEAVDFLTPGQGKRGKSITRSGNPQADQPEGSIPILVPGKTVPEAHDKRTYDHVRGV